MTENGGWRLMPALGALLLALGAWLSDARAAQATLQTRTEVRHYAVSGNNELALLREMRRKGPRVGGRPALASTRMRAHYTARLKQHGSLCRVRRLDMAVRFTMTLPRLRASGWKASTARRRWPEFVKRLVRHEKQHIAIWKDCLQQVRRKLPALQARSCSRLKRKLRSSYDRIMAECARRHDAFDRREKHAAASLPFIRAAFSMARRQRSNRR